MLGVLADHADDTLPPDDLALVTHPANARSDLHPCSATLVAPRNRGEDLGPVVRDRHGVLEVAGPLPVLPVLDGARELAQLDPGSNEYGFLKTQLVRERNKVLHALDQALERADALRQLL